MTTSEARQAAARVVISIDAEAARVRADRNRADQRMSLHPEPDGVATLIVRGPAEQLLAAHKTLDDLATALRAAGDTRTRGQISPKHFVQGGAPRSRLSSRGSLAWRSPTRCPWK